MTDTPLAITPNIEIFHGMPIRIVQPGKIQMVPVNDVADGINYERSSFKKLMNRNMALLEGDTGMVRMTTPSGDQDITCISRDGLLVLLSKVDYLRIKDATKQRNIIEFQKWVKETLSKEMQIQTRLPEKAAKEGWVSIAHEHLKFARIYAEDLGIDLGIARARALVLASRETGIDLTGYSRLLPSVDEKPAAIAPASVTIEGTEYFSASEIAKMLNARGGTYLKGSNINKFLENKGFAYKNEDGRWCMTDEGYKFGKLFPYAAKNGHTGYFLRWKPEVMQASGMIRV